MGGGIIESRTKTLISLSWDEVNNQQKLEWISFKAYNSMYFFPLVFVFMGIVFFIRMANSVRKG